MTEGVYVHLLDLHWVCTEKNWHLPGMHQVATLGAILTNSSGRKFIPHMLLFGAIAAPV